MSEYTTAIPDAKTIWLFKDTLSKANGYQELFTTLEKELEAQDIITHEGTMIDASFIESPKQRNSRKENELIKEGHTPKGWSDAKRHQKDTDARWTKKNNTAFFGYKNHVSVDMRSKLILAQEVTTASVHDSQVFESLMDDQTQVVFADSAYLGQELPDGVRSEVMTRSVRNHPLTDKQIQLNHLRASIRCRVEHVFAFIENSMSGSTFRGPTIIRAKFNGMITSLTYNLFRIGQVKKARIIQRQKCVQM
ncbi:IS5 family transposase [Enterococcus faecalis]|nr:IS5 family transposase [Enterococcus faecalis]